MATVTIARDPLPARRIAALLLLGLSAFAFTLGTLLRVYVAPRFARLPLDPGISVSAVGPGVYLDPLTSREVTTRLTRSTTVSGAIADGTASTANWTATTQLTNARGELVARWSDVIRLNRTSGQALRCCDNAVTSRHVGLGYAFGPGAERRGYPWFDPLVGRAFTAEFVGRDRINGLATYRYACRAAGVVVSAAALPPGLGQQTGSVRYDGLRTVWVEPSTGVVVREVDDQRLTADADTTHARVLLDASLAWSAHSTSSAVRTARDHRRTLRLLELYGPIAALSLGLAATMAAVGTLLVRSRFGAMTGRTSRADAR
jgi:hypothetical protein